MGEVVEMPAVRGQVVRGQVVRVPAVAAEVNLAVVSGTCSAAPEVRLLDSGTRVASLSIRCPADARDERATSVPVTVWNPAAWVETLVRGDEVLVVGRVRRRFYSRPGGVGSRVDVDAVAIARARDRRRVEALARRAAMELDRMLADGWVP
jgi:single-stranded DNA-binding protein